MHGWKKGLLVVWLAILLGIVLSVFWYNEWKYSLPTPVPQGYNSVPLGTKIDLTQNLINRGKPTLLHFFNPDCPCSRFNMKHVKGLIADYGEQVNFIVIVVADKVISEEQIQKKYGLKVPVLQESSLAEQCGVYSTPQAVILNKDKALYYRGNYNKSRYCSEKKSNYAQIALERLLKHQTVYKFNNLALKAYGCQLPGCTE